MHRTLFNDGWAYRPKTSTFTERAGAGDEWTDVVLPHDALIGTERRPTGNAATGFFDGGVWEYQKTFEVDGGLGQIIALEFEGVYRDAIVYLNGVRAAHWPYGYSCIVVPIDHLLRDSGSNQLRVEARAGNDSRWYTGAGIHRNVWLLQGPAIHVEPDGLFVRTVDVDDDLAVLGIDVDLMNGSSITASPTLRCEVLDGSGDVVAIEEAPVTLLPGSATTARRRLVVTSPRRWTLAEPYLYTCQATVADGDSVDCETATFGIRTVSADPRRGFRLNGEPIQLRGACVHHDNGPIGAATISRADERRIELLKDAGFNAIRSAHNPMSRAMLDACDRLGMLVMDETFDMWREPKSDDDYALRFDGWWERDVEAMVRKDRNHPSVVFYSIGNEIPDGSTSTGLHTSRRLADKVRALDDSRLVTQGVSGFLVAGAAVFDELRAQATTRAPDEGTGINTALTNLADLMDLVMPTAAVTGATTEAFAHLDVAGYNYMDARFDMDGKLFPNRTIVSTESYAGRTIDREWRGVTDHDHVIGEFTWTGWDYLGEVGLGRVEYGDASTPMGMAAFQADFPWLAAWCGDLDITGYRRPQSYYREIVWGRRSEPYIAVVPPDRHGKVIRHASPWAFDDVVASWTWTGYEGQPVTIHVYADADDVELRINGVVVGTRPAGPAHGFRATFDTTYQPGDIEAVARRDGREVGSTGLRSASGTVELRARVDRDEIEAGATDLAFVELALVDDKGSVWTSMDRSVTVSVEGPGALQGLASANPQTQAAFTGTTCTTFLGRALAVVRPVAAGTITVVGSAEDCVEQRVTVTSR